MVKILIGVIVGLLLGTTGMIAIQAAPVPGFRTDPFVRMIEAQFAQNTHMPVEPGASAVLPNCGRGYGCSVKYIGAKIDGHVYWFGIDKLD